MWANRMPRGVLPVKLKPGPEVDTNRLVYTDPDDFLDLIRFLERNYFCRSNYFCINKTPLFSIFDSTFFVRQLGVDQTKQAIKKARKLMVDMGYRGLHIIAINPAANFIHCYKEIGFDSLSHYVWLPEWKGDYLQDYRELTQKRSAEWLNFQQSSDMPYFASISPGWDASPRAESYKTLRPKKYPWWPIVTDEDPELFCNFLKKAIRFSHEQNDPPIIFIASWNEWSEGHYLEPDTRHGTDWLKAVQEAKPNA